MLVLVLGASLVMRVESKCKIAYPYTNASNPLTSVAFSENGVLRLMEGASTLYDTVRVYYNDEHALLLGLNNSGYTVTPLGSVPDHASQPSFGNPAYTDPSGRYLPKSFCNRHHQQPQRYERRLAVRWYCHPTG